MCNGKCAGAGKVMDADRVSRITAILSSLASNPEFIRTVELRYGPAGEAPSMKEIATALIQVEDYLSV
jgi:hypothetical protein